MSPDAFFYWLGFLTAVVALAAALIVTGERIGLWDWLADLAWRALDRLDQWADRHLPDIDDAIADYEWAETEYEPGWER